jgi:hypothetical protein
MYGGTITDGSFAISGTIYVTAALDHAVVTPAGTCPIGIECIFWADPTAANVDKVDISAAGLPNGDIPAALAGNDAANISNLTRPPEVVGPPGFAPETFMTFNNGGITTTLMLNFIENGIYSADACGDDPVAGQQCTLPGSLFNFVNNPPPNVGEDCGDGCQATATWVFDGVTAGNSPNGTWTGNFTSQFDLGTPYQTVFADLAANGYVQNTFSATITLRPPAPIPEPATIALSGGVLVLVGLVFRSRLVRKRA